MYTMALCVALCCQDRKGVTQYSLIDMNVVDETIVTTP